MPAEAPQTSSQKEKEYVKVAPCLYRHVRTGRYYGCKKVHGRHREHSLGTADRQIAERRLLEWTQNLSKVDAEVEKTTLDQLVKKFVETGRGMAKNTQVTTNAIIKSFKKSMGHDYYGEVRNIRPSRLDEWLASEEPRLRNTTYNRYAGFAKQLFDLAVKDRVLAESPAKALRTPWKKPQEVKRVCPTFTDQFPKIVESIRTQPFSPRAQDTADFVEFMGLAGLGQAEVSNVRWSDIQWSQNQIRIRRCKTDTVFYVPIYPHLRPFLERLKKQRGAMFPNALVFKIKDAKKALTSACKRLG
jgi:integrase